MARHEGDPSVVVDQQLGEAQAAAAAQAQDAEASRRFNARNVLAAVGATAAIAGGVTAAYFIGRGNESGTSGVTPVAEAAATNESACNQFEASAAGTNNPARFNATAFLPRASITDNAGAKEYIAKLFAKDGTVAGGSPDTLAALMATVVVPAEKGSVNDPNYDYIAEFNDKIAAYQAVDGQSVAVKDCNTSYDIITQVAGYNGSWARAGEHVSEFKAQRDDKYGITGAELTKPQVVQETLSGIELTLRDTTKGVNGEQLQGFPTVLITQDGKVYVKGLKPTQQGTSDKHKGVTGKDPFHNNVPGGSQNEQNRGGSQTQTSNGGQGQRQGGGGGGSNSQGKSPEKNVGANPNGPHGSQPGPENTPSGGPNTTPETTTTTTPNTTTTPPNTTTTTPPTHTETTPPTTTTTPPPTTTTTTTETKPPAPCDPNAGEVC